MRKRTIACLATMALLGFAPAVTVVAVADPVVTRAAVSAEDGSLVLAVGAPAGSGFATTWRPAHFEQVPRAD